jgi:hypothetical protein
MRPRSCRPASDEPMSDPVQSTSATEPVSSPNPAIVSASSIPVPASISAIASASAIPVPAPSPAIASASAIPAPASISATASVNGIGGEDESRDHIHQGNLNPYLPFGLVALVATSGIVYSTIVPAHWLRGVMVMASGLGLAAVFRLVLPSRQAGLLAVRSRAFDVVCFGGCSLAIVGFGLGLPG